MKITPTILFALAVAGATPAFADNRPIWDEQRNSPIDFLAHVQPDKFPSVADGRAPAGITARRVRPTFDDESLKRLSAGATMPDLAARPANN